MFDNNFEKKLIDNFLRYVKIDTTSDPTSGKTPSTDTQWILLEMLRDELEVIGLSEVVLDDKGYIRAVIPASKGFENAPVIGFLSHVDTSHDVSGKDVNPLIHENYDGKPLVLGEHVLDPEEYPLLLNYKGRKIITSDGSTLLGADDKAGVAEIITTAEYIMKNPEIKHGKIEIFFTPDEEIGKGTLFFPFDKAESEFCYTFDGDAEGVVEYECFNAYTVTIRIQGKVIHLGSARGKLVNALKVSSEFISMLPGSESPESTDGRYGYYCPLQMKGGLESSKFQILIRDFETEGMERRIETVKKIAETLEKIHPGCSIKLEFDESYKNMRTYIDKEPKVVDYLYEAVEKAGIQVVDKIIRGGTDGARLAEMGIPCPNIFTGGSNFHSRIEWAAVPAMVKACEVMVNLSVIWAEKG